MAKRAKTDNDTIERLKVVGSVLFFVLCGLALTALTLWGPYGWVSGMIGALLLILAFVFWPAIISLFQHRPKRAIKDE